MRNNEELRDEKTERRIRNAIEHTAPDALEEILTSCEKLQKGNVIPMNEAKKRSTRKPFAVLAVAAAVLLVLAGGFFLRGHNAALGDAVSMVSLDVNPSLQLEVDSNKKVVAARALNEDAKTILGDMNLKGTNLDVALNAVVGSLLQNGYLESLSSAILVTVEDENAERAAELQLYLDKEVDEILQNASSGAARMSQVLTTDTALEEQASANHISVGRAHLIEEVRAKNPDLAFEDLAKLSVEELRQLCTVTNVKTLPIGKKAASEKALAHAGLIGKKGVTYKVEAELNKAPAHYSVELYTPWGEFEYKVDAASGKIQKGLANVEEAVKAGTVPTPPTDAIGEKDAIAKALEHAGFKPDDVRGMTCRLDLEDGKWVFEVEFRVGNEEYEYEIAAVGGSILESDKDREDPEDIDDDDDLDDIEDIFEEWGDALEKKARDAALTAKQAIEKALSHAGIKPAEMSRISCDFDMKKGKGCYEVEFSKDGTKYEITIDANSGAVLKAESERED